MTETAKAPINEDQDNVSNLHAVPELQRVTVREDLALRPLTEDDAEKLLNILERDPQIRERVTVASRMHTPLDVVREIDAMNADPELIRYAIVNQEEQCIGLVSLWKDPGFFGQEPLPETYGFGYFLDPAERGKGIVTSSVSELMQVASDALPLNGFTAFCEDGNTESVSVLAKLGFEPTDTTYPEPTHGWEERQYIRGRVENE